MITEKRTAEILHSAFDLARKEWPVLIETLDAETLDSLIKLAESTCIQAGEFAVYASYRQGFGCGDQGQTRAWKAMLQARRAIRRALGYTYP